MDIIYKILRPIFTFVFKNYYTPQIINNKSTLAFSANWIIYIQEIIVYILIIYKIFFKSYI